MEACDLGMITLTRRATGERTSSMSLPEAVAWFAGEDHSDRPRCLSPVLHAAVTVLSDRLAHPTLQRLKWLVPSLVGTAQDGLDGTRSLLAVDWLVRVYTPAWLRIVPSLDMAAESLAEHAPITSVVEAADALEAPLAAVRRAAWSARVAVPGFLGGPVGDTPDREAATVSLALSDLASEAAVAATVDVAAAFLPVCGRMRLAAEQAVLIATRTIGAATDADDFGAKVAAVVAPTADALDDAVVELFVRLIEATPPPERGWLADDPVDRLRRRGPD
ncbi:hypothetical protein [Saccharomonospora sp. NB11]|jgi:hypothetical protein|uniref:hypothetical protein n=1 Tax=Saccharomonospora sp. NB11 TaxID=1642298 RepID=UPI0018D06392|nr:hypothetical protein [Saccharomonospora sp. NB11]